MSNKLFVAGIPYSLTDLQLEEHFSKVGNVLSAKIITDRNSGQSKGFGFVEMATTEEAQKAMTELNNTMLGDRTIIVKEAIPQENKGDNRGGYKRDNRDDRRSSNRW